MLAMNNEHPTSMLHSDKVVRIKQWTDVATIVLQKLYHAGLNKIKYGPPLTCLKY